MQIDALHAARLAQLEGAACALLREAATGLEPNEVPDSLMVILTPEGLDIEYRRGSVPVGGEGL